MMLKKVIAVFVLFGMLHAGVCTAGETPLKLEDFSADKADRVKIKEGAAVITYGACLKSKTVYPIVQGKQYGIKGTFTALPDTPENTVMLGFEVVDKDGKVISMVHARTIPGTLSRLVQDVKATDTVVKIEDGSRWKKGACHVAFKAAQDSSDLPNRNIAGGNVIKVEKKEMFWEITLKVPCGCEAKAGEWVREHQAGGYIYTIRSKTKPGLVDPEQTAVIDYAGAAGVRAVILANWGVIKQGEIPRLEIKNLRLIEK